MTIRDTGRNVSARRKTVALTSTFGMGTINYYDGYWLSLALLGAPSLSRFYQKSHKTRRGDFDSRGSIAEEIVSNSPLAAAVASERRKTREEPNVHYILLLLSYKCDGGQREREDGGGDGLRNSSSSNRTPRGPKPFPFIRRRGSQDEPKVEFSSLLLL